jgi:hypothetical protein
VKKVIYDSKRWMINVSNAKKVSAKNPESFFLFQIGISRPFKSKILPRLLTLSTPLRFETVRPFSYLLSDSLVAPALLHRLWNVSFFSCAFDFNTMNSYKFENLQPQRRCTWVAVENSRQVREVSIHLAFSTILWEVGFFFSGFASLKGNVLELCTKSLKFQSFVQRMLWFSWKTF